MDLDMSSIGSVSLSVTHVAFMVFCMSVPHATAL